jgi:hypothetical protein
MRCRFIVPVKVLNPQWSENDFHAARDRGEKYTIPQWLDTDPGYEIEGPDAWLHCCPGEMNSAPRAEAVDDECKEAVRVWMEDKRPGQILLIKAQLEQIDKITNPQDKARLLEMGKAYGLIGGEKKKAGKTEAPPAT